MRRSLRGLAVRIATAVVLLTGMFGIGLVSSSPAYAASCSYTSCNGLDPSSAGCDSSASSLYSYSTSRITDQLRYSSTCRAVWYRHHRDVCGQTPPPSHYWIRVQSQLYTPYGWSGLGTQSKDTYGMACDGTKWTLMVPAGSNTRSRTCVGLTYTSTVPTSWDCDSNGYGDSDGWIYQ